ncbi:MAG: hypothetical protein ACI4QZ_05975 [Eubacteriales bacterium]
MAASRCKASLLAPKDAFKQKKALAEASAFFWWGMVDSDHRSQ